jgi:hypothetical protein
MTVPDLFEARVMSYFHKPCIISAEDGTVFSYAAIDALANRVAHWAEAEGVDFKNYSPL